MLTISGAGKSYSKVPIDSVSLDNSWLMNVCSYVAGIERELSGTFYEVIAPFTVIYSKGLSILPKALTQNVTF